MERVGTLINKLKEQLDLGADNNKLLATTQLLVAELLQSQGLRPEKRGNVSVVMPTISQPISPNSIEINRELKQFNEKSIVDTKQQVEPKATIVKKEESQGWLFDPMTNIPTLAHQDQKEVYELNDVILTEESLNDKLKEDKPELATVLHSSIVKDLKKAIGFNDRHLFIYELFRGDEDMYERSIKTINNFTIHPEAQYWIQRELKLKIGWDEKSEAVKLFDQLVNSRFS